MEVAINTEVFCHVEVLTFKKGNRVISTVNLQCACIYTSHTARILILFSVGVIFLAVRYSALKKEGARF
jgi:hypothetical protein